MMNIYLCALLPLMMLVPSSCHRSTKVIKKPLLPDEEAACARVSKKDLCLTIQFEGGRLGNQLFEVATALSIAKDNNCTAVFPMFTKEDNWDEMTTYGVDPHKLFASYLLEEDNAIFSKQRLGPDRDAARLKCFERHHIFAEDIKVKREDYARLPMPAKLMTPSFSNMLFKAARRQPGWGAFNFFSYKIFDHHKLYIQKILGPSDKQKQQLKEKFKALGLDITNHITCGIHMRRGDRAAGFQSLVFPPLSMEYYKKALEIMDARTKIDIYVVFSDDAAFAKDAFTNAFPNLVRENKIFFVDYKAHQQTDYQDLWFMSLMTHQITANSTFSWWAAYLNENHHKIVLGPAKWWLMPLNKFGITYEANNMSPPTWTLIDQY